MTLGRWRSLGTPSPKEQRQHLLCEIEAVSLRGPQFKTEELQRCCDGGEDGASEVTVTVATTATYGDRFRVVCRHRRAPRCR